MKIDQYISELLYDHECVIVTDLGGFITNYKPASINTALHVISPPSKKLAFNASLKSNDGLLANHVAQRSMLNYMDACDVIRDYVKDALKGMKDGQKLKIDNVGVLYFDQEENLQFLPDNHANYFVDSFGMVPVHAPLIKRSSTQAAQESTPQVHAIPRTKRTIHKKAQPFRWNVLEMIPAAAVLAILIMTPPVLQEFNTNLSTLLPFSRMNEYLDEVKGIREEKRQIVVPYVNPFEIPPTTTFKSVIHQNVVEKQDAEPAQEIANAESNTIAAPESTEVVKNESKEAVTNNVVATTSEGHNYFIIGGCFRSQENAEKFLAEMKSKGMDASIIGQNKAGLYMVSLYASSELSKTNAELPGIKSDFVESAWVYKK